jgi:hypothetical protein
VRKLSSFLKERQWFYSGVFAWNNARRDTWGLRPPVRLKSRHMTFTVLTQGKTQTQKNSCTVYLKKS